MKSPTQRLHQLAAKLPDTTQGVACKGTSLEKTTFKVHDKAFLFLGLADAMLKLNTSLEEAKLIAKNLPNHCKVGGTGWVTVKFADGEGVPNDALSRWVKESYQLFATSKATKKKSTKKKNVKLS